MKMTFKVKNKKGAKKDSLTRAERKASLCPPVRVKEKSRADA